MAARRVVVTVGPCAPDAANPDGSTELCRTDDGKWRVVEMALPFPAPMMAAGTEDGGEMNRQFRATGHPHHALMAWRGCRMAGVPIPSWVAEYIDGCVSRYEATMQEAALAGGKLAGEPNSRIAEIFGFAGTPGRKNWATEMFNGKAMEIGLAVETAVNSGEKQCAAFEAVAKAHGLSAGTVRKYHRVYKEKMRALAGG